MRQYASKLLETAESGVDKVVSSCEKNPSVHKRYINFLRQRKTALDAPLYAVSAGRSMIEMLGVLAIIAVLSVGGIAGYSKAMEKFKINKTIEQYNYLILGMLDYIGDAKKITGSSNVGLTNIAEAAGLIPTTWSKETEFNLRDEFRNIVQVFADPRTGELSIDFALSLEKNSTVDRLCLDLFNNILLPIESSVSRVLVLTSKSYFAIYYGKNSCTSSRKCLKDAALSDIRNSCDFCAENKGCSIAVKFGL